jgi:hypothetical protein
MFLPLRAGQAAATQLGLQSVPADQWMIDRAHGSDNDPGFSVGAMPGKPIHGHLSREAELMLGVIAGERGNNRDWSINSVAGYAVYRTRGDLHVKAKPGDSLCSDKDDNDTNLSAGIDIVLRMGRGIFDLEYTQINPRNDHITVGYIMPC